MTVTSVVYDTARMRVLVVVLLLFVVPPIASGSASAESEVALIVDLDANDESNSLVLERVRRDLHLAGYARTDDEMLRQSMVGPLPGAADWSAEEAQLANAEDAYESFELPKAIAALDSFDRGWKGKPSTAKGIRLLSKRYLLGGLVRFAEGNRDKARDNFRLSHRLAPSVLHLDRSQYRPALVTLFEEAVKANQAAVVIRFRPDFEPAFSKLFVDGRLHRRGSAMLAGPHLLSVEAPGFERAILVKMLAANTKLVVRLQKTGRLAMLHQLRRDARTLTLEALGTLTAEAGVHSLVLLRRGTGSRTGAVYRHGERSLTQWAVLGSAEWQSALSQRASHKNTLVGPHPTSQGNAAWYKTWWGGGLLVVGGSAIVGSTLFLLLSPSDSSSTTIGEWCFENC